MIYRMFFVYCPFTVSKSFTVRLLFCQVQIILQGAVTKVAKVWYWLAGK